MSAMRAEDLPILPELPAASPQDSTPSDTALSDTAASNIARSDTAGSDSARTRAAVRWTAPLDSPAPAPGQAPRPQPSGDQAARSRPARDQATRPETANPPLRLTRRGRVVVAVAAALVLAALSLVIAERGPGHQPPGIVPLGRAGPRPGHRPSGPEPVVGRGER